MYGERAEKRGRLRGQWWGRRPLSHNEVSYRAGINKFFKRLLHKKERIINKQEIENDILKG